LTKLSDKIKLIIKNLKWQDYVFIGIIVIYLVLQINLMSGFKALPSPIYGGDYYYSMGTVQHVLSGGNPFVSPNVLGSEPLYLPLYTILVSVIGSVFGLSAFAAMKIFAIIHMIVALIVFYFFANYLFKNKHTALFTTLLYLPLISFPVWKYLQFTMTLVMPAFIFSLLYFFEKKSWVSAITSGVLFGLLGISHTVGFVTGVFIFVIIALYKLFFEHLRRSDKRWIFDTDSFKKNFSKTLILLIIIGFIGSCIAMLYWFKPIFVYHGEIQQAHLFTQDLSSLKLQFKFIFDNLKSVLFNFSDPFYGFKSIFFAAGVLLLFFIKKYQSSTKFLVLLLVATLIGSFHFVLTQPLLGTNLSPIYIVIFSFGLTTALLCGLSAEIITGFAKKYKNYIFMGIILIILLLGMYQFVLYSKNDKWINAGRNELSPNLQGMQKWVLGNTDVNDVFLSTNELSFALNGLTGRKEVVGRKSHNSMFLDVDKRQAAAAVILYGNDTIERKRLLEEYSVDYFYWDYYWIQSEYYFDNSGKMTSWFDPLSLEDNTAYNDLVQRYNISFFKQHTWPDPAVKGEYIKQIDLIFILPTQFDLAHPWHPDLDNYLEEVWSYKQDNVVLSRIYKIVNTS